MYGSTYFRGDVLTLPVLVSALLQQEIASELRAFVIVCSKGKNQKPPTPTATAVRQALTRPDGFSSLSFLGTPKRVAFAVSYRLTESWCSVSTVRMYFGVRLRF